MCYEELTQYALVNSSVCRNRMLMKISLERLLVEGVPSYRTAWVKTRCVCVAEQVLTLCGPLESTL